MHCLNGFSAPHLSIVDRNPTEIHYDFGGTMRLCGIGFDFTISHTKKAASDNGAPELARDAA